MTHGLQVIAVQATFAVLPRAGSSSASSAMEWVAEAIQLEFISRLLTTRSIQYCDTRSNNNNNSSRLEASRQDLWLLRNEFQK